MNRVKIIGSLILIALLMFCTPVIAAPTITLDDKELSFEVPPIEENGRTLVPLRAIFEALGATVTWDETSNTVTAVKGNTIVSLRIGETTALVSGRYFDLDVPAKIVNGRTLAPLRFVGEAFGETVKWYPETGLIALISTSDPSLIGLSKSNPVPKFKPYLTKQGIEVTVNNMTQDLAAVNILQGASSSNKYPERDMKYVIVTVTVNNVSSPKEFDHITYDAFRLTGSSKITFDSYNNNLVLTGGNLGSMASLKEILYRGDIKTGSVTYYVPKYETDMVLIWDPIQGDKVYFSI